MYLSANMKIHRFANLIAKPPRRSPLLRPHASSLQQTNTPECRRKTNCKRRKAAFLCNPRFFSGTSTVYMYVRVCTRTCVRGTTFLPPGPLSLRCFPRNRYFELCLVSSVTSPPLQCTWSFLFKRSFFWRSGGVGKGP
jgi:hypothetical protein